MRPPVQSGLTAGERYARLRLQQMVRAGLLRQMPQAAPGGYAALWRAASQGINERAQRAGYASALQAARHPRLGPWSVGYYGHGATTEHGAPGGVAAGYVPTNFLSPGPGAVVGPAAANILDTAMKAAKRLAKKDIAAVTYGVGGFLP